MGQAGRVERLWVKTAGGARWRCCRMRWHMAGRFFFLEGGGVLPLLPHVLAHGWNVAVMCVWLRVGAPESTRARARSLSLWCVCVVATARESTWYFPAKKQKKTAKRQQKKQSGHHTYTRAAAFTTTQLNLQLFTTTKLNLQLPFNLHGTFHWRTILFSPSRSYLLGNCY